MESLATVERAVDLLFHLHRERAPLGVSALGRALGIPKSSAHRLVTALARRGLVERDPRGRWRPGLGLVALGLGVLEREPVVAAARPVLEAEAAALGETVFLAAARGGQMIVLDKAEGTGFLRAAPGIGQAVPGHATAVGRLQLAFAPEALELESPPYPAFTPRTPVDAASLAGAVAEARATGVAESREEWIPGVSVLAAPIRVGGRMLGAIAVAAPSVRLEVAAAERIRDRLRAAAEGVGARLSGLGFEAGQAEEDR